MSLPKPVNWSERPTPTALGALIFAAGVGIVCLIWAAAAIRRANYLTAIATSALAVFMVVLLLVVFIGQLGRVSPRGTFDSKGTVVRVGAVISRLFIAGMGFLILSTAFFAIFIPSGDIEIPLSTRQTVAVPIGMAVVGFVASVGAIRAISMGGLGSVRLTPHGFQIVTMFSTERGRWSDVVELTDVTGDKHAHLPIVMVMKDGSSQVIKAADNYTPYGRGLYWMVRHYWLNPEHRGELTDGRALDRLRCEQFEVDA